MTCFVQGDAVALFFGRHLILLLQPTDDSVDGVHKVLSRDEVLTCTSCDQGSLVTYIGNVCSGEAWGAPCKQIYIYRIVDLERTKVDEEDLLAVVYIG